MTFYIEDGAFWALGITYLILVVYCLRHYVRVYTSKQQQDNNRTSSRKSWAPFFYPMLVVGCTIRGSFFIAKAGSLIQIPNVLVLMNTLPTLVLFSAYMIVLLSWAQLYHSAEKAPILRTVYFCTNTVLYCCYILIYILGVVHNHDIAKPENVYHKALWYLCSFMYFMYSSAFLTYALLLVRFLRVALFASKFDTIKQINYFTFLVVLVNLIRCAIVILEANGMLPYGGVWWFIEPVYFAMLEVLPLIMMVQIFQMHRTKATGPTVFSPLLAPQKPRLIISASPALVSTAIQPTTASPFLISTSPRAHHAFYT